MYVYVGMWGQLQKSYKIKLCFLEVGLTFQHQDQLRGDKIFEDIF